LPPNSTYSMYGYNWAVQGNPLAASYATKRAVNRRDILRFEIREGDKRSADPVSVNRIEVGMQQNLDDSKPIVFGYDFKVEVGEDIVDWLLISQVHQNESKSPPFSVNLDDESLEIVKRSSSDLFPDTGNGVKITLYKTELERERWYSLYASVRVGDEGGCIVEIDGVQVVNYTGYIGYDDGGSFRLKYGIYRAASNTTQAVQFRNFYISN